MARWLTGRLLQALATIAVAATIAFVLMRLAPGELKYRKWGPQPHRFGETELWVIPSSSGLASKWHAERLTLMHLLARRLNGDAGDQG